MTQRPYRLPEWATDPFGAGYPVEPDPTKIEQGWQPSEKPPSQFFNWWMQLVWKWLEYLDGERCANWITQSQPQISSQSYTVSAFARTEPAAKDLPSSIYLALNPVSSGQKPLLRYWVAANNAYSTNTAIAAIVDEDDTIQDVFAYKGSHLFLAYYRPSENTTYVLTSTNNGSTWTSGTDNELGTGRARIYCSGGEDPVFYAYAASSDTLLQSKDFGVTWTQITIAGIDGVLSVFAWGDEGAIVAIVKPSSGPYAIWKSDDDGDSWSSKLSWDASAYTANLFGGEYESEDWIAGLLYCVRAGSGLYRSEDYGDTWTLIPSTANAFCDGVQKGSFVAVTDGAHVWRMLPDDSLRFSGYANAGGGSTTGQGQRIRLNDGVFLITADTDRFAQTPRILP